MQAVLPADVLTGQGSTTAQQLSALAAMHAAIRAGQADTVSELRLVSSELGPPGAHGNLRCSQCMLSPVTGACTAAIWDDHHLTNGVTVVFAGGQELEGPRSISEHSTDGRTHTLGWSAQGTYLASFHLVPDSEDIGLQVCDLQQRAWLPEYRLDVQHDGFPTTDPPPRFSLGSETLVAVKLEDTVSEGSYDSVLLVFGVQQRGWARVECDLFEEYFWLPGAVDTLLLLRYSRLRRVQLGFDAEGHLRVQQALAAPVSSGRAMALVPDSPNVLVYGEQQVPGASEVCWHFSFFDVNTLRLLGTWTYAMPGARLSFDFPSATTLVCSRRMLAVSSPTTTRLFPVTDEAVGSCCASFGCDNASCPTVGISLSCDGLLLVGCSESAVHIWNFLTGALVTRLPPVREGARALGVAWAGQGRLHVKSQLAGTAYELHEALLSVLQFG